MSSALTANSETAAEASEMREMPSAISSIATALLCAPSVCELAPAWISLILPLTVSLIFSTSSAFLAKVSEEP